MLDYILYIACNISAHNLHRTIDKSIYVLYEKKEKKKGGVEEKFIEKNICVDLNLNLRGVRIAS